ncbi:MAG: cobalamin-binding protein [Bacteroidetes bacterium]|nr:MAG: cobalamin-binding protein [Bacteroidota bacterium]
MIFLDQLARELVLDKHPTRVVCLVPSITELLYDMGLDEEVVGITKFCIHPDSWYRSKVRVGGTKQVDYELIKRLAPDLIIGNKEENTKEMIEVLSESTPVYVSDIHDLDSAIEMITSLGVVLNKKQKSEYIVAEIKRAFDQLKEMDIESRSVKYYIWKEPDMLAGKGTFIDDMLRHCGWINATDKERYPIDDQEIEPDLVLLSSEPYPFSEKHINEFRMKYPNAKIKIVDGEMFSWYGSHLLKSPQYFKELISEISQ